MKPIVAVAAVFAFGSALSPAVRANPKGMGPSAIEAARLKTSPPRNYLSHYLPDDRYKIAGGVWKYVSTDLDTYFHLPASSNMMRQPADRVIGFSSVRDAEEAGYVADPTDGTSRQVAASRPVVVLPPSAGATPGTVVGNTTITGNNDLETRYLGRVIPLLLKARNDATSLGQRFSASMQRNNRPGQGAAAPAMVRQMMSQLLRQTRSTVANVERIRPPARFRRFHSLLSQSLRDENNLVYGLNGMMVNGNLGGLMQMQGQIQRSQLGELRLRQEANRLGIGPQMEQVMGPPSPVVRPRA